MRGLLLLPTAISSKAGHGGSPCGYRRGTLCTFGLASLFPASLQLLEVQAEDGSDTPELATWMEDAQHLCLEA